MIKISLTGKKNIFAEIAQTYERYIRLGVFREGERLPSVRELALTLGINPNTVERAYAELESRGLVRIIPKKGAYVCGVKGHSRLYEEAVQHFTALQHAGLSLQEAQEALGEVYGTEEGSAQLMEEGSSENDPNATKKS